MRNLYIFMRTSMTEKFNLKNSSRRYCWVFGNLLPFPKEKYLSIFPKCYIEQM